MLFVAKTPEKVDMFHDNQYWEVADDYGRSFWSELGLVVDGGKKDERGNTAMEVAEGSELQQWMKSKSREQHVCWMILAIRVSLYLPYACQIHKFDSDNR